MPNSSLFRRLAKRILYPVLRPLSGWYLSSNRSFTWKNIRIGVQPGVFHPGLFISTKILLDFLSGKDLAGKKFLELGAGSGIISVFAAQQGAFVTASDISEIAVANIQTNAIQNQVSLTVILSDLFVRFPEIKFDIIVINPPYYPRYPESEKEYAFFCGEKFEYFERLFAALPGYILPGATIWMILSEDCDIQRITAIGEKNKISIKEIEKQRKWGEWNYIFSVEIVPH
ncbi:MAG: methyltransferase [Bacteroidia bacterium]|nr:methyltransferase [Bacteroidia bacterium]